MTGPGGSGEHQLPATVPVFPLPEAVFFPRTLLPLHVFEPRYRQMVRDSRTGDRIIAMALLKPGWEPEYYGAPDVYPLGCAGTLEEVVELENDRYNIKLSGVCRVRFLSFESERPYRIARVLPVPENVPPDDAAGVEQAKLGLVGAYALMSTEQSGPPLNRLRDVTSVPLQVLVNTFCSQIDLPVLTKQHLLGLDSVLERCLSLTELILRECGQLREDSEPEESSKDGETVH